MIDSGRGFYYAYCDLGVLNLRSIPGRDKLSQKWSLRSEPL